MDERPTWRRMFDAWNEQVGPRLEQYVRTDAFADQAAWFAEFNRQRMQMAEEFTQWLLHIWNIPSASDVAGLKRQLEALDRQLTRLNKTVQEAWDASGPKRNR
jgi:hypothetical protein